MIKYFQEIIIRDLQTLKKETELFKSDKDLWQIRGEIINSAGNLALHLCGNLNHFIGAVIGKTGYIRQRDEEFSAKNLTRKQISQIIDETIEMVEKIMEEHRQLDLKAVYPQPFAGRTVTNGELLFILASHFAYHLGQVNYLRRMLY